MHLLYVKGSANDLAGAAQGVFMVTASTTTVATTMAIDVVVEAIRS